MELQLYCPIRLYALQINCITFILYLTLTYTTETLLLLLLLAAIEFSLGGSSPYTSNK